MEGFISGKLHSHEDWLGLTSDARELIVTLWSWAIDHEREDGEIPGSIVWALSASLGHTDSEHHPTATKQAVEYLTTYGWLQDEDNGAAYRLLRWDEQGNALRKARERREKERERYQRRKKADR